jgi:hypothetical protein
MHGFIAIIDLRSVYVEVPDWIGPEGPRGQIRKNRAPGRARLSSVAGPGKARRTASQSKNSRTPRPTYQCQRKDKIPWQRWSLASCESTGVTTREGAMTESETLDAPACTR